MTTRIYLFLAMACMIGMLMSGCTSHVQSVIVQPSGNGTPAKMQVTSDAFADGQPIPDKYTCHGDDVSPPLQWNGAPSQTKSFAITCEDPDAPGGTFTHWMVWSIFCTTTNFPENIGKNDSLPNGSQQGKNSFGNIGYNGPCPPGGSAHHYIFKVYALDASVLLEGGASKEDLLKAINGHVLAEGELTGTYQSQ
jgi:Raf kinase inhibitor-like YbhB/YbcL family protein